MLKIVVIDDGIGCEQKEMTKNKHHFGVRNIIESMNLIGGKVEFYTKPNEGMNIVLKVPCSRLATEKSEGSTK
jgi:signal transduction histidine kinase